MIDYTKFSDNAPAIVKIRKSDIIHGQPSKLKHTTLLISIYQHLFYKKAKLEYKTD